MTTDDLEAERQAIPREASGHRKARAAGEVERCGEAEERRYGRGIVQQAFHSGECRRRHVLRRTEQDIHLAQERLDAVFEPKPRRFDSGEVDGAGRTPQLEEGREYWAALGKNLCAGMLLVSVTVRSTMRLATDASLE